MTEPYASPSDFISSQMQQAVKTFSVYDGSNRLIEFYTASKYAKNGEKCLKSRYTYDGATSRILKTDEDIATWDSTWDMP